MKKVQITSADINRVDLQQLYQTAFPEEEQIPWKELMRLVDEMPLDFNIVVGTDSGLYPSTCPHD